MELADLQSHLLTLLTRLCSDFHKLPGSAILLRYVQSSYQNDPIRSAVELFLVLFAVRYLMAPKYSVKPRHVALSEEVSQCGKVRLCEVFGLWGFGGVSGVSG
jgi:serine palmitoyltransferase